MWTGKTRIVREHGEFIPQYQTSAVFWGDGWKPCNCHPMSDHSVAYQTQNEAAKNLAEWVAYEIKEELPFKVMCEQEM